MRNCRILSLKCFKKENRSIKKKTKHWYWRKFEKAEDDYNFVERLLILIR